jgi:Bacterial HORMA domain family 1
MSYSTTISETVTFSHSHAKHMAAKVATDLKRMQRFYGLPSDVDILKYEEEVIELLKGGYLKEVTYGFKRDGQFVEPSLRYTAKDLNGGAANDDDPGRLNIRADISGAKFYTYLTWSAKWYNLSAAEQDAFRKKLPFTRTHAEEPGVNGYLCDDRTYSAGGWALNRKSVKKF